MQLELQLASLWFLTLKQARYKHIRGANISLCGRGGVEWGLEGCSYIYLLLIEKADTFNDFFYTGNRFNLRPENYFMYIPSSSLQ